MISYLNYKDNEKRIHELGRALHDARVRYMRTKRHEDKRAEIEQLRLAGFTWNAVAEEIGFISADHAGRKFRDDRSEALGEQEVAFLGLKIQFERATGLRDGDEIPAWLPFWRFSGCTKASHHFGRHTDGMPVAETVKKELLNQSGADGSSLEIDHKDSELKYTRKYYDGWFISVDSNDNHWHRWENVRLIPRDEHLRKSADENGDKTHARLKAHVVKQRRAYLNAATVYGIKACHPEYRNTQIAELDVVAVGGNHVWRLLATPLSEWYDRYMCYVYDLQSYESKL